MRSYPLGSPGTGRQGWRASSGAHRWSHGTSRTWFPQPLTAGPQRTYGGPTAGERRGGSPGPNGAERQAPATSRTQSPPSTAPSAPTPASQQPEHRPPARSGAAAAEGPAGGHRRGGGQRTRPLPRFVLPAAELPHLLLPPRLGPRPPRGAPAPWGRRGR